MFKKIITIGLILAGIYFIGNETVRGIMRSTAKATVSVVKFGVATGREVVTQTGLDRPEVRAKALEELKQGAQGAVQGVEKAAVAVESKTAELPKVVQ